MKRQFNNYHFDNEYHKVSVKHLQAYLNEFTFKYNRRNNKSIFDILINKCALQYI